MFIVTERFISYFHSYSAKFRGNDKITNFFKRKADWETESDKVPNDNNNKITLQVLLVLVVEMIFNARVSATASITRSL